MMIERVSCIGHARHWFSRPAWIVGGTGDVSPWCVRCGAPNPRCADCGAATHASTHAKPEATGHTLCANGHHHWATPAVKARQLAAAINRDNRRRDRKLSIS